MNPLTLASSYETAVGLRRSSTRSYLFECSLIVSFILIVLHGFDLAPAIVVWAGIVASGILTICSLFSREQVSTLDYAVVALLLFEVCSIATSTYPANSWLQVERLTLGVAAYFCVSRLRSTLSIKLIVIAMCLLAVFMSIADLRHFLAAYSEWKQLAFGRLSDVKQSLTITDGTPSGEHFTRYLYLLGWALAGVGTPGRLRHLLGVVCALAAILCTLCILLSLSRGLYLALCIAIGTTVYRAVKHRDDICLQRCRVLTFVAIAVGVVGFLAFNTRVCLDLTRLIVFHDISQARSFEGRLHTWSTSIQLAKEHPLVGFGSGTYVLYGSVGLNNYEGDYVDQAFSTPVQLFFEHGIVSFVVYGALLIILVFSSQSRAENKFLQSSPYMNWIADISRIFLLSLLVRDLSYSTLFREEQATVGAFSLAGLLGFVRAHASTVGSEKLHAMRVGRASLAITFAVLSVVAVYRRLERGRSDICILEAVRTFRMHREADAVEHNRAAMRLLPSAFLDSQTGLLLAKSAHIDFQAGTNALVTEPSSEARQVIAEAKTAYESGIRSFGGDADWHFNQGWLHWANGDRQAAVACLRRAVDLDPATPLYRQSLIMMHLVLSHTGEAKDELLEILVRSPEVLDSRWWQQVLTTNGTVALEALRVGALNSGTRGGTPISKARQARLLLEMGDEGRAGRLLEDSLAALPGLSSAWRNYALILAKSGHWIESERALERAVFLNPWDYSAYYALSRVVLRADESNSPLRLQASQLFLIKAERTRAALLRTPESLRVPHKFGIKTFVRDDAVVNGLIDFCLPTLTLEFEKVVPVS